MPLILDPALLLPMPHTLTPALPLPRPLKLAPILSLPMPLNFAPSLLLPMPLNLTLALPLPMPLQLAPALPLPMHLPMEMDPVFTTFFRLARAACIGKNLTSRHISWVAQMIPLSKLILVIPISMAASKFLAHSREVKGQEVPMGGQNFKLKNF